MEIVISISSVVIAICAAGFTIWQTNVQRIHNRVSVKPHLFSLTSQQKKGNASRFQVILINNGLGPAFINKFQTYNKDVLIEAADIIPTVFSELSENCSWAQLGNDCAIASNERKVLLDIIFPAASNEEIASVEDKINGLDLVVEYSSAYEKMEPFDSREKK
jgi:hypothetical protein